MQGDDKAMETLLELERNPRPWRKGLYVAVSYTHLDVYKRQAYARRKDKNLRALMQYAGMFKVEKILRQYLEVLL